MKYLKFLLIPFFLLFGTDTWTQNETQDIASLEKELEETSKAIDEYVSSLSPKEQAEFNKAVEEVTEMIENMSEEEFTQFLDEAFGEEFPLEEPEEEVVEKKEEMPEPVQIVKEEEEKQSQVISLIDAIINHTNTFVVKIASSADLPGKIEFWGKQGTIKEWPTTLTWKDFKQQLENFNQQLHKIKDQDPQTKKYKYLNDFIKDEALYNNLAQLKTNVSHYEPMIEIPEFGLGKLSVESKQAAQKTANAYTEALYVLKIPEALEQLFKKFEPAAKKLRAEEEELEKKAAAQAKKIPTLERVRVGGKELESDFGYTGASGYRPTTPSYRSPTYTPSYRQPTATSPAKEEPGIKKPGKPGKAAAPTGKPEKPGEEKPDEKKEPKTILEKKDPNAERLLGQIVTKLEVTDGVIKRNEKFNNLEKYLASDEVIDVSLANIDIPEILRRAKDATSDIKALDRRVQLLGSTPKKYYKEELQGEVDKYKGSFQQIIDAVDTIEKRIEGDEAFNKSISDEKKYAYLDDEEAIQKGMPADAKTIAGEVPHPTSLYELRDILKDLLKTAKDFGGKKPPSVRPGARPGFFR